MAVNNSLTQNNEKKRVPFSVAIQTSLYQNLVRNTLVDPKKSSRFITAITSAVSANPKLQNCDAGSILSAGFLGESLNLSPSPQLGMYYIVPYGQQAQFQLGYKGYIQLAIRSGQYRKINVVPIKQGELVRFDPLNEEIEVNMIDDESERENTPTTGYYAFFEYLNGFRKAIYWSREKMEAHAKKYSKNYSFIWGSDFDKMACKTMLRQLISKWGIMSVDMEKAFTSDMAVIKPDGSAEYIDNPKHTDSDAEIPLNPVPPEPVSEQLEISRNDDFASIMEG